MPAKPLPPVEPVTPPEVPPASLGWGARIETLFIRFVIKTVNSLAATLQNILSWSMERFTESFEASLIEMYGDLVAQLTDDPEVPEDLRKILEDVLSGDQQAGAMVLAGFGSTIGSTAAGSLLTPLMNLTRYKAEQRVHSSRFSPATAIPASFRSPENAERNLLDLIELGWDEVRIEQMLALFRPVVSEGSLIQLWRRNILSEEELNKELFSRGWPDDRIEQLKRASELIPGIQDLILMAVREVFSPEAVISLSLGSEFPEAFGEIAETLGMSKEWAERYWMAHWKLPSLGQGFEMFQRLRPETTDNPFTLDDLRGLIKAQDFAPVWRERLIQIAYRPYTRVDVRRMFRDEILTEEQVFSAYKDIGYDDEKAGNLTAWTITQGGGAQKDLTRAAIIKGYKKRVFTVSEARQTLSDIGMGEDQIEFWVSLADLEIAEAQANEIIGGVQFLFVNGAIDTTEVYGKLGSLNMPAAQVEELLTIWSLKREAKTTLPGRGELEEFYERGIITESDFRAGLLERRYRPNEVQWYIDKSDDDIAQRALVEAERSAREQDRIIASELSSDYAVARSGLDVEIAELKLSVAETTLAIKLEADPAAKQAMKEYKAELAVTIATRKVEKAQLAEALALAKSE